VYEWDEATETATIDLRYNPNETTERTGPEAAAGDYLFADAGPWALFSRLRTPTEWSYTGSAQDPVTYHRSLATDGPGATGDRIIYLGNTTSVERTENGQRFRLIVPDNADLAEPPERILNSLTNASGSLQVGDRDETVVAFAAPTDRIQWGVRGLELGGSEFWVRDTQRLDEANNVWLHEYVHTRQAFSTTRDTRWVNEGTAVYYAALLALEQERIDFAEFADHLDNGERSVYSGVVLSDPATWTQNANYVRGALVTGVIDEQLRAETNQSGTFEGALSEINGVEGQVTQDRLLTAVENAGGNTTRTTASEYTTTTASVSMWTEATHSRLFGQLPARISYALPNRTDGYQVSGPYRNGTLTGTPVRLATGETLTVASVVLNTGGTEGAYNATLTVDGAIVTSESGTIEAESERTVPLSHRFEEPGEHTVGVGQEQTTVVVQEPVEPAVTNVTVDSRQVQQGDSAVVTATVRNDAPVPANGTVVFTRDGEPVAQRVATVAPGNTTQLSVPVSLPAAGEVRLGAGSAAPVTVTVVGPTDGVTEQPTTGADGPGFTMVGAALAVVLALLARRR